MPYEENDTKITRLVNYLRMTYQTHLSPSSMTIDPMESKLLNAASSALAHLARFGGPLAVDIVEFEIRRALEWLEDPVSSQSSKSDSAHRKFTAALILRDLASSTPSLFHSYVDLFLAHVWNCIRDPRPMIRFAAIESMRECLLIIARRASRMRARRHAKIFAELQNGMRSTAVESIHGSLLLIGQRPFFF